MGDDRAEGSSIGDGVKVKVAQSCLTLCNPMDRSPWNSPGQNTGAGSLSLLQGIFLGIGNPGFPHCRCILYQLNHQGSPKILEWVAHPFSNGSSQPRNLSNPPKWAKTYPLPMVEGRGNGYLLNPFKLYPSVKQLVVYPLLPTFPSF